MSQSPASLSRLALLIGYGDIGQRLTPLLHRQDFVVAGARRHPEHVAQGQETKAQAEVVRADAARSQDWEALIALNPGVIVMTFTPPEYSEVGYEQGYVQPIRAFLQAAAEAPASFNPLIFFVSSTTVYGESNGEWVNEFTPVNPQGFSGDKMLQAEHLLRESPYKVCILRCSGIYGPGREHMKRSLEKGTYTITPAWTNRVHVDDIAEVIEHLIQRADENLALAPVYLITDDEPLQQEEVVRRYGYDPANFERSKTIGPRGSKRLSNQLIRSTGFQFRQFR